MTGILCTFWPFYQWSRKCSPFRSMNCLTFRISPLQSVDSCWSLFSLLYSVLWTIILSFFIWFVLFCFFLYGFFIGVARPACPGNSRLIYMGSYICKTLLSCLFLLCFVFYRAPEFSACFTWVCRTSLSSCQISRFLGNLEVNICLFRSTFRFFVSWDKYEHPDFFEVKASVHSVTTTMRL